MLPEQSPRPAPTARAGDRPIAPGFLLSKSPESFCGLECTTVHPERRQSRLLRHDHGQRSSYSPSRRGCERSYRGTGSFLPDMPSSPSATATGISLRRTAPTCSRRQARPPQGRPGPARGLPPAHPAAPAPPPPERPPRGTRAAPPRYRRCTAGACVS